MRRVFRHLFTLCSAALGVLCIAVCVMWVRSYWTVDLAGVRATSGMYCVGSYRGHLVWFASTDSPSGETPEFGHDTYDLDDAENVWNNIRSTASWRVAGFSYSYDSASEGHALVTPLWSVAAATALLPALCARAWLTRRRRRRLGLCARCGYDLRASPDRCPECGAAADAAQGVRFGLRRAQSSREPVIGYSDRA